MMVRFIPYGSLYNCMLIYVLLFYSIVFYAILFHAGGWFMMADSNSFF